MSSCKKIKTALISVFYKDGLDEIVKALHKQDVKIYSTGGTQLFIEQLGIPVTSVETLTGYPSILGGRVKTLHPKIFGGILAICNDPTHQGQLNEFGIPAIDLVIVDLYPFRESVASGHGHAEIIEKIDIGGISLIRAAAKNYKDVVIVPSVSGYAGLLSILRERGGETSIEERYQFAVSAFAETASYDAAIFNYLAKGDYPAFNLSVDGKKSLRYGENPHQKGTFHGDFNKMFSQLHGKEISYNNLLDIDAAVNLIADFEETTVAILKHNNACGIASRPTLPDAWLNALAADPVSAFGGVIVTNVVVDDISAIEIDKIFFEVIIAPAYTERALSILGQKKNRIILEQNERVLPDVIVKTALNGILVQDRDDRTEIAADLKVVTNRSPIPGEIEDLLFANKIVKHSKSNAIVLARDKQMLSSGVGQTSRVDALKHAVAKATSFGFDLTGAVMASDAFFPFPDSVEIAANAGITAVIQPGGSVRDAETIEFCNKNNVSMVITGNRHFKH